jgi:glutamate N-acetyltransferase/amino-acid N-acetyltransferase
MPQLHLLSPRGFRSAGVHAGIKRTRGAPDVGLLVCDTPATAAAVFTTNKVFAAPVAIGRQHIEHGNLRGVVVNSGNANACTGSRGLRDARKMCALAARSIGCRAQEILPSSTGIIGQFLPMTKLERGIVSAAGALGTSRSHAQQFADAILTTDTKRKTAATQVKIGRETITIAGVCKGSGMIGPRMSSKGPHATLLAYLTTDAKFSSHIGLGRLLQIATDRTFNAVTVDDHTSTNDTAAILASGASCVSIPVGSLAVKFLDALTDLCQSLAYQIAADGEGATKVVTIHVRGARSDRDARTIARAIANSPLVKCAMNGNDPNWGRIVSAAGLSDSAFDPERCELRLQDVAVFRSGRPMPFDAARLSRAMARADVNVELDCRLGKRDAVVWTCDLSKDYVRINADYHT